MIIVCEAIMTFPVITRQVGAGVQEPLSQSQSLGEIYISIVLYFGYYVHVPMKTSALKLLPPLPEVFTAIP